MNINVRVLSANARAQIAQLQAQVKSLQAQLVTAGTATSGAGALGGVRSRKSLGAFGNQIQWTGRQLQYNWTLPLLLAGGAATKFALGNEQAMTRVTKVYGDASDAQAYYMKQGMSASEAQAASSKTFQNELNALGDAFEQLSSHYGVQQKEVLETASAWAAAGSSGLALAESTELSLKAAVLGDMSLAKATDSLIAIQSQYSLSTKELNLTLSELNAIENQTGISMEGLIEGFSKSAGSAREYGIDVRHLGAMLAALVPATGTAATAGQSLKTIFSRIMAPTKESADLMREFGVDTRDSAWQGMTAMERLQVIAGKMKDDLKETGNATKDTADDMYKLSDSQRAVVATTLGSRYQVNRFLVLMRELNSEHGYYQKALNATKNNEKVFQQSTYELNKVLESSPKRLEILWYTIQNGMADAIQPLIPYLLYLVQVLQKAMSAFGNLDPSMQKFILLALVMLAAVGPLVRMLGSFLTLIYTLGAPIRIAAKMFAFLTARMLGSAAATGIARLGVIGLLKAMIVTPIRVFGVALGWIAVQSLVAMGGLVRFVRMVPVMVGALGAAARAIPMVIGLAMGAATALPGLMLAVWRNITAIWVTSLAGLRFLVAAWGASTLGLWGRIMALFRLVSIGSIANLPIVFMGMLSRILKGVALFGRLIPAVLTGPWGLAIAAIIAVIMLFRKQIAQIWNNIVKYFSDTNNAVVKGIVSAWNMLPKGVANALMAVVNIVASAAKAVYSWFSYLNPFAHHSPSLVENVTKGMDVVTSQFGRLRTIKSDVMSAYSLVSKFGKQIAGMKSSADAVDYAKSRASLRKYSPGALGSFDKMIGVLKNLKAELATVEGPMNRQQAIVDAWQKKVDVANHSLDQQQKILDSLTKVQQHWQDQLSAAQDRLSNYANAPLVGMRAMSDAIFDNEMAQKKLRLEMMKMEDVAGTLDDVKSKMDAINGAQELLRGEQTDLRSAGAGSDILGFYDDQITALDKQKQAYKDASAPLQTMQDQLDALQRKGEELDLTNSLQFDPLTRQIEQAANAMKELPFDEVMAGVQSAQADIAKYNNELANASKAVADQQAVVDRYTAVRDKYQASLDAEEWKLKQIKDRYDDISDAIQKVEGALNDVSTASGTLDAAKDAKKKKGKDAYVSPAVQNFRDAAGGNFANVGGAGIPMRKNWADQSDDIKKFTADLAKQTGSMFDNINPFTAIKKKWNDFKSWIGTQFDNIKKIAGDFFSHMFAGVGGGVDWGKMFDGIRIAAQTTVDWLDEHVIKHLVKLWKAFWPPIKEVFSNIWDALKDAFKPVAKELKEMGFEFSKLGPAFKAVWSIIGPIVKLIAAVIVGLALIIVRVFGNTIGPIIRRLGDIFANVLQMIRGVVQIISGVLEFLHGVFTLNFGEMWDGVKKFVTGIYNLFAGFGGVIGRLLQGAFQVIIGAVWGIVKGIWDWFKWLWDELVGHSIVPDMINGIIACFKLLGVIPMWVWDNILKPVYDFFVSVWHLVQAALSLWWSGIQAVWSGLKTAGVWIWNNMLVPVWDKVKLAWQVVKAVFALWWNGIKNIWSGLKAAGGWIWDNMLSPVWGKIKYVWELAKTSFGGWWNGIKTVWNALKGLGKWFYDNVMKPVYDKVTGVWNSIKNWLSDNANMLASPMKAIVNTVIGAVNKIIEGLNAVSKALPGISFHINVIPKLAEGGNIPSRMVGSGFKTTGARAIVGEGKANYPEYVIPTDPTHRRRATVLLASAANDLGMGPGVNNKGAWGDTPSEMARVTRTRQNALDGVPMYSIGGVLGDAMGKAKDLAKGAASWVKGNIRKLATTPFAPYAALAKAVVNTVDYKPVRGLGNYGIDKAWEWVHGADDAAYEKAKAVNEINQSGGANGAAALKFARAQVGKPYVWGGVGPAGYDCSGFMSALVNVFRGKNPYSRVGATASFPWPGFSPGKGAFTIGSTPNYGGSGIGHMAGTIGNVNVESRGGVGPIVGGGARGWNDGGFSQHAHIGATALKEGGIALANRGPALAAIADGRYDEAVVPLPKGWRSDLIGGSGGDTHIYINGNLEFPNIKNGSDAGEFIKNLEMLAGDE